MRLRLVVSCVIAVHAAVPPATAQEGVGRNAVPLASRAALRPFAAGAATRLDVGRLELTGDVAAGARAVPLQGPRSTGRLIAGGLLAGAIGFFGGGFAGAVIACDEAAAEDDLCAVGGFIVGASIAESLMLPLGVHVANDGRGEVAGSLAVSAALTGVALYLASTDGNGVYLIPVPPLQLLFSTLIERSTSD